MLTENIKRFLEEAKKTADLPDDKVDTLYLNLDEDVIQFIEDTAKEWECTVNDVLVATIMALCDEFSKKTENSL